jgi:hypothetical protein
MLTHTQGEADMTQTLNDNDVSARNALRADRIASRDLKAAVKAARKAARSLGTADTAPGCTDGMAPLGDLAPTLTPLRAYSIRCSVTGIPAMGSDVGGDVLVAIGSAIAAVDLLG